MAGLWGIVGATGEDAKRAHAAPQVRLLSRVRVVPA
jgi:hypothetical protein